MLSSIFTKTIYEKRWGIFWWSLTMFGFTLLVVLMFPTFRDTFGTALSNVPDSLKSVLGEANDYQRLNGFLELQVFMQMIFLTFIYGIILFSGLIAGAESDGTLQSLLAQPVSRSKVYFQKLAAGAAILGIVSLALFVGAWLGAALIHEHVSIWRILQATFGQWLVSMVFSLVALALGASLGKRGIAGALAGVYAFVSYLVYTLSGTVKALQVPNKLAPFKYFTEPRVLDNGLQLHNVAVLVVVCAVLTFIGWYVFARRDVYQH
jgi:ABC-2 type transport system permease protein